MKIPTPIDQTTALLRRIRAIAAWSRATPDELGDRDSAAIFETISEAISETIDQSSDLRIAYDAVWEEQEAIQPDADGVWPETWSDLDDEFWQLVEARL